VRELRNVAERSTHRWLATGQNHPIDTIVLDPFASAHRPPEALTHNPSAEPRTPTLDATHPFDLQAEITRLEREAVERQPTPPG